MLHYWPLPLPPTLIGRTRPPTRSGTPLQEPPQGSFSTHPNKGLRTHITIHFSIYLRLDYRSCEPPGGPRVNVDWIYTALFSNAHRIRAFFLAAPLSLTSLDATLNYYRNRLFNFILFYRYIYCLVHQERVDAFELTELIRTLVFLTWPISDEQSASLKSKT